MKKPMIAGLTRSCLGLGLGLLAAGCSSPAAEDEGSGVPAFSSTPGSSNNPGAVAPGQPGAPPNGAPANGSSAAPGGTPSAQEGTPNVGAVTPPTATPGAGGTPPPGAGGTTPPGAAPGTTPPVATNGTPPTAGTDGTITPPPGQPAEPPPAPRALTCAGGINVAANDVISDFNTAQPIAYTVGTRGGTLWETFAPEQIPASNPTAPGNAFRVEPTESGPCNSGGSLHVSSPGNTDYGVGFGINFRTDITPGKTDLYDARADGYTGVAFYAQCRQEVESVFMKFSDDATDFDVQTPRCSYNGLPPLTTLCRQYGVKNAVIPAEQWTRFELYFDEALLDTVATTAGTGLHSNALTAVQVQFNTLANARPNGFDCFIDDVHFLRNPTPRAAAPRNVTNINGHTIAPGGYYTEGNRIFDSTGAVHLFKGFARPSFEFDPAGLGITREDVQRMRAKGANVVRYALSEGYWLSNHPQFNRNYQAYIDRAVQWTLQAGMDVIIDLHWSGSPVADQQQMASRQSITFWQQVAQKYRNDGRVIFELYNEPYDVSAQVWRNGDGQFAGMQEMYNVVRAAGANNLVLAGGLDYAYDLDSLLPGMNLTGINIAYVTHPYRFKVPAPPANYDNAAASFPIVATEFGDAAAGFIGPDNCDTGTYTRSIADFTNRGIGWTAWAWVVAPDRCAFPALLERYDGTPTPPGAVVFQALAN